MIRLMLATYSKQERDELSQYLENVQRTIEATVGCHASYRDCRTCRFRHLCTDLLAAAVFAKDYKDNPSK